MNKPDCEVFGVKTAPSSGPFKYSSVMSPATLIKKNIERFITAYEYEVPHDLYLTENQLDLFSEN